MISIHSPEGQPLGSGSLQRIVVGYGTEILGWRDSRCMLFLAAFPRIKELLDEKSIFSAFSRCLRSSRWIFSSGKGKKGSLTA